MRNYTTEAEPTALVAPLLEPLLPVLTSLDIDQLRDVGREVPLVFQARYALSRRDPPVLLPVQAHEDVALLEVGAVERSGRMRPGTELEHHWREGDLLIWDNLQTMHRATDIEFSNEEGKRRMLYRISAKGLPQLFQSRNAA